MTCNLKKLTLAALQSIYLCGEPRVETESNQEVIATVHMREE